MKIFDSKVDSWMEFTILLSILLCLTASICIALTMSITAVITALLIAAFGISLPLWILLSTCYITNEVSLTVKSGPFKWEIPLNSIKAVSETRNPISSPALSLDRVQIDYDNGARLLVSPEDKQGFIKAIGF